MNPDLPNPAPVPPPRVPDHELIRRIGRGAYGEVWLARSATGAFRAVKTVHRSSFDHDRPFEREFEGILKFEPISRTHDSQVDILHVGRSEDCFYYVMELADDQVTGGQINPDNYTPRTLKSDVLFRGRIEFEECVRIGVALATALEHLHVNGLVHRDVKPSNIIFVNGVPKLADIGLVAGVEATRSYVGTEGFAAPEGPGSPQADLYSLGKVLYEISTGKDRQEFPELPTQLRELPDREGLMELNAVIARACRHDPRDRYTSAATMRADLEFLQSGKSLARLHRAEKRLRFVQRVGVVVTAIAALIASGWLWQARQTQLVRELGNQKAKLAEEKTQLAQESRQRVIQIQTANGLRAMDEDDLATAALWFAEVLKLADGDPDLERRQRFRLGTLFRHVSKPAGFFPLELPPQWARVIAGEQRIAAASKAEGTRIGELKVWETSSGQLVSSVMLSNIWGHRVSPSGRWSLVSGPEGNRLCETLAGTQAVIQLPFRGRGEQSTFAEDESKLAIAAFKGKDVQIIEMPSGRPLSPMLAHTNEVSCLRFDLKGRQLATGTTIPGESGKSEPSGRVRVWDANTGEPVTGWLDFDEPVTFASFSPDGRALAVLGGRVVTTETALKQNLVHVIDLPSARPRFPPLPHKNTILAVVFSPDGRHLATASADQSVMVWNAFSGEAIHPPLPHDGAVKELRFSPDGRWLAAVEQKQARIWDVRSGSLVTAPLRIGAQILRIEFTPDGSGLVVTPSSGPICVWNLSAIQPVLPPFRSPDGRPMTFAIFSRDGKRLVTVEYTAALQVWDPGSGRPLGRRMEWAKEGSQLLALSENRATWSADERWIAVPSGDSALVWDANNVEKDPLIIRHEKPVLAIEFSPVTNHLVTASADNIARVWDMVTGQLVTPPLNHTNAIGYVRFSPDGRRIATSDAGGKVWIWDAGTGQSLMPPLSHSTSLGAMVFSPDGSRLATSINSDDKAIIWDAKTGKKVVSTIPHLNTVTEIAFTRDSRHMVTASMDHTARVWDTRSGEPVTPALQHGGYVVGCAFNPEGDKVVTASHDGTARIWDAFTGEPLSAPFRHEKAVLFAAFSPDGRTVVTTSRDGTAQLWETPTLDWPIEEVQALAQVLAGGRVASSGRVEPLNASQLETAWRKISARLPANCLTTGLQAIRWHRVALAMSEQARDWFATDFHSKRLLALLPDDREVQESRVRVLAHLPPPRDPATPLELIDLSGFYNASLEVPWHPGPEGNHLAELPRGIQTLTDTRFDVRGLVQVLGKPYDGGEYRYPKQVVGIPVNRKLDRLQILHSIQGYRPPDGTRVGHYHVNYASGRREEIPIIYGQDARDWHEHPNSPVDVTGAVIAWKGNNPAAKSVGTLGPRLFKRTWKNPAPDVEVTTLDFAAEHETAHPFLIALTAE